MGPEAAAGVKTESSDESTGEVTMKVISESHSSDASAADVPENSDQPVSNISDKGYPCPTCGKTFDRLSKLERHKPIHKET
ncbi:zinc finger and SCAN domain-containing protein 26-like [Thalassophryne amazonica]|uniref:zinc finger and SCAN domain-containing protein 26-like n=1 Tax=Thalassophryne amazonica TaxID=390379 RepID=UPI001470EC8A|nr:zinc finger and SCAN domain-containing protein 26-like [Thalassophryne amazonica]